MKKIAVLLMIMAMNCTVPVFSAEDDMILPNIFIWSIPDEIEQDMEQNVEQNDEYDPIQEIKEIKHTKKFKKNKLEEENDSQEVFLDLEADNSLVNFTTLKGFAEYKEGVDDIHLDDNNDEFALNIRTPQKIGPKRYKANKEYSPFTMNTPAFSKYNSEEYNISKSSTKTFKQVKGFSFGTMYATEIDNSQLEQSTSLFTRYEYKKFAVTSSYRKLVGTTHGNVYDSLYITPEWKLNNIFTLKDVIKSDITTNRKSNEIVLSINPFGNRGSDRLNFELGAGQTFDQNNELMKTKIRFSTQFKL